MASPVATLGSWFRLHGSKLQCAFVFYCR